MEGPTKQNGKCANQRLSQPRGSPQRSVAKVGQNVGPFRAMLVLIETVGAAQMELGSSNAQKAQRVYNAYRFRSQKGNSG